MNQLETRQQSNPWEKIYAATEDYRFYDLKKPHDSIEQIIKEFSQAGVQSVLDLGCGLGRNSWPLIQAGFEVTAVDLSPTAVTQFKQSLAKSKQAIPVTLADFRQLPFKDNCFDAVISVQVINHGYEADVKQAITEVARVLNKNGKIFITVPGRIAHREVRYCLVKTAQKVEDHTYVPTNGKEKGQPHVIFNQKLIYKLFHQFQIYQTWKDPKDYYCILGELR
jgi:SAM-dependent methyltransferase